jgi:hypothetical protein
MFRCLTFSRFGCRLNRSPVEVEETLSVNPMLGIDRVLYQQIPVDSVLSSDFFETKHKVHHVDAEE